VEGKRANFSEKLTDNFSDHGPRRAEYDLPPSLAKEVEGCAEDK
jgi:hypothetical protein